MIDRLIHKYLSRKFFAFILAFTCLNVALWHGVVTSGDYVNGLLGLTGMYIFGNVIQKWRELANGSKT